MKIFNVIEICDNGEFITLTLEHGAVHLPLNGKHSLVIDTIDKDKQEGNQMVAIVNIDLYQG